MKVTVEFTEDEISKVFHREWPSDTDFICTGKDENGNKVISNFKQTFDEHGNAVFTRTSKFLGNT